MPKYRKKPVVIEAIQWTGSNLEEIKNFLDYDTLAWSSLRNAFLIHTLEGNHECSVNDFVIKGVKGEFYPCKPDVFEMTYEKVEE